VAVPVNTVVLRRWFARPQGKVEMTRRYLAPAEGPAAQAWMNAVFAGLNTAQSASY
jgi:hypothetical protein